MWLWSFKGAQLIVSEKGIEDLLFAQSAFPTSALAEVSHLPGVLAVNPVVAVNGIVGVGHTHLPVYMVGFESGMGGGPWLMGSGSAMPHGAELVVDRGFASIANVTVGDTLTLFGHALRVVGISEGTNAAGDFFVFAPLGLAQEVAGTLTISYGLVHLDSGAVCCRRGSKHQSDSRSRSVAAHYRREQRRRDDHLELWTTSGDPRRGGAARRGSDRSNCALHSDRGAHT